MTPTPELAVPAELASLAPPAIATEAVPACPLCAGADSATFAEGFDYELLTCRNRWRFVACRGCGHVRLDPRPAVATLPVIYPPSYYAYNYESIPGLARSAKAFLDGLKLKGIVRGVGRPISAYLDVGCGDGRYLRAMRRRGVPDDGIFGLELDERVVRELAAQGFQVFCERAESAESLPSRRFDLVTMFHVIEHLADPRPTVARIRGWLAPGGLFAVETPNLDSLDARLFKGGKWGGYHIPRHWNLFTPGTLARLLRESGFEPLATRYLTGHSFWMYSFHHALRYGRRPRPRLARRFDPFRSVVLLGLFTVFDKLRAAAGLRTSSMLMLARKTEE